MDSRTLSQWRKEFTAMKDIMATPAKPRLKGEFGLLIQARPLYKQACLL
jgi:hypothetical protein